jgi:putative hemolysin
MVSSAEERERCIATKALDLTNTRLCELSGTRRDRCLVSIVALKLNESICTQIRDLSFKDDCYIEMAGGKKDAGYCANILDASKKEFCLLNASVKSNVTAIANPAAVNCRKEGYDYEIRKDNESNEYGICMYNGKECDEWALYRKECCLKEGDCAPGYDCIANACITNSTYNQTRHDQIISEILAHSENSTNKTG